MSDNLDQPSSGMDGVVDTSSNKSFLKGLKTAFSKSTPHSGFNKLLLIFLFLAIGTTWWWSNDDELESLPATTDAERSNSRGTVSEDSATPEVVKEVIEEDTAKAEAARKSGSSYFGARPETQKRSMEDLLREIKGAQDNKEKKDDTPVIEVPEPEPVSVFKEPDSLSFNTAKEAVTAREPEGNNKGNKKVGSPYYLAAVKRLEEDDGDNNEGHAFLNETVVTFEQEDENELQSDDSERGTVIDNSSPANILAEADERSVALRAGHFTFAFSKTAVNTDLAVKDVVAEIMGGPLDTCRLIGTWKRVSDWNEELSLVFSKLEYNGEVIPVDLIAFDIEKKLPGFVSEVDRHILVRWGGLISGSLLSAISTTAVAAASTNEDTAFAISDDELKEVFVSSAGDKASEKLIELYDRPITSKIYQNQEMQVLAMEPVLIPNSNFGTGCQ